MECRRYPSGLLEQVADFLASVLSIIHKYIEQSEFVLEITEDKYYNSG